MPGTPVYQPAENLHSAVVQGDEATFRALLATHADPDNIPDFPQATLLHFTVMQARIWAVEAVLEKGADPNRVTPTRKTALDLAEEHAWRPLPKIVDILTAAGGKRYHELPDVVAAQKHAVLRERAKTVNPKIKF
ncbi:MAG: hypothetical protein ACAH83_00505 [Alphaproteobacteria bacterium]